MSLDSCAKELPSPFDVNKQEWEWSQKTKQFTFGFINHFFVIIPWSAAEHEMYEWQAAKEIHRHIGSRAPQKWHFNFCPASSNSVKAELKSNLVVCVFVFVCGWGWGGKSAKGFVSSFSFPAGNLTWWSSILVTGRAPIAIPDQYVRGRLQWEVSLLIEQATLLGSENKNSQSDIFTYTEQNKNLNCSPKEVTFQKVLVQEWKLLVKEECSRSMIFCIFIYLLLPRTNTLPWERALWGQSKHPCVSIVENKSKIFKENPWWDWPFCLWSPEGYLTFYKRQGL